MSRVVRQSTLPHAPRAWGFFVGNDMDEREQKALLEQRVFIDYIMPYVFNLFGVISGVITKLNNDTFAERAERTEIPPTGRSKNPVTRISTHPLTQSQIHNAIEAKNLGLSIRNLKGMLFSVDLLSVSESELISFIDDLPHISSHCFSELVNDFDPVNDPDLAITDICFSITECRNVGYGKPEKYNQLFYFIARKSIEVISNLGY